MSSLTPIAQQVCEKRYFQKDKDGSIIEDWNQLVLRVVKHVCKDEDDDFQKSIYDLMYKTEFLPNSPCLVNAGTATKSSGLSACFVSESPTDCWSGAANGEVGMIENIANFGHIARQGGGAGIDLSLIRPEGDPVFGSTHAKACGPIEHMRMLSEVMSSITQSGFRGMAMLACMRVDHPDILKFITCKRRDRALKSLLKEDIFDHYERLKDDHHEHLNIVLDKFLSNFNISVSITDVFMNKVKNDEKYDLVFNGKIYQTIKARQVFDYIIENAWNNGDPGLLFYDTINNNGTYRWSNQTVTATNPCITGETLVSVADGRMAISIQQLAAEDEDVPVYCRKPNGGITIRMMRRPRISGYNQKILKVTITNGHVLRVTENHQFTLSDGSIKKANDLELNDSLSIMTRLEAPFEAVIQKWNSKSQNYYWLKSSDRKSWKLEHRMIYNFATGERLSYQDGVIHHKDFDGLNNYPENLEHMTKQAHDLLHAQDMIGDKNPMRRAKHEWSDAKWDMYKSNMSKAVSGFDNGRAIQISNKELFALATEQTKQKRRKLSVPEWRKFSKKNGLVSSFTQFRSQELGRISKFLTNAALEAKVDGAAHSGSVLREYKKFLNLQSDPGLDIFFEDTIKVRKLCEHCCKIFTLPYYQREVAFCSVQCSLKKRNISEKMKQQVRDSKLRSVEKRRFNLLATYNDLKSDLQRDPLKKEFSKYCKQKNIPFRIPSKNEVKKGILHEIFSSWNDLKDQADSFNHRIVSIESDGFENVYTGTVDDYHNYYVGHFEEKYKGKYKKFVCANNPQCGEIPIPESGCCNLGSIDVSKFYNENREAIEWTRLGHAIRVAMQFLDDVIDANTFPTSNFKKWAKDNRPVGLGIMGWADLLLKMKTVYGSESSFDLARKVGRFFQKTAHEKSVELGKERGVPRSCRYDELEHRRNVVTLSIAPTGTISLIAGCSSSIEPIFSAITYRYDNTGAKEIHHSYASKSWFRCAADLSWQEHVGMQAAFQSHIDNSISKTINFPNSATKEDVANAYMEAHKSGCKGITVYRDGCKTTQVLNTHKLAVGTNHAKPRPKEVEADIFKTTADGLEWHVIVGKVDDVPYEVFAVNGKQNLPSAAKVVKRKKRHYSLISDENAVLIENLGDEEDEIHPRIGLETRRFSLELRHNIDPKHIVTIIDKSSDVITSFSKAVGRIMKNKYISAADLREVDVPCLDCAKQGKDVQMIADSGCWKCPACFGSRCG